MTRSFLSPHSWWLPLALLTALGCSSTKYKNTEPGSGGSGGTGGSGGQGGQDDGLVPLDPNGPMGWASVPDLDQDGTYGGRDGEKVVVSAWTGLVSYAGSFDPYIIHVDGEIEGTIQVQSDKTIIGEPGAVFRGHIEISGAHNVIIKNLTIVGNNCTDGDQCSNGADAITVKNSHHLWFDHLDISDGSDGNLDITQGSNYVTVSWNKFWYSDTSRNHRFSNLVGASDDSPQDEGKLKVTFHHNWWADNAEQRMPRTRYGDIHILNNLYASVGNDYCINSGVSASLLVESNAFVGVSRPHEVGTGGNLLAVGNLYEDVLGEPEMTGMAFKPPYEYTKDETSGLAEAIREGAGPTKASGGQGGQGGEAGQGGEGGR